MACDLITTELAACESGIGKIDSQTRLLQLIAQLSCEIADAGGSGGGGTPGGAFGDVQFNDAGAFGGFGDYNSGTSALTLPGTVTMPGLLTIAQATANTSSLISTGYSLTGANAQSLLSLAGTWNTTGTPTAIDLNITNTASNAASLLLNLRVGGVSFFKVGTMGAVTAAGAGFFPGGLTIDGISNYTFTGRGYLTAPADGIFTIWNFAATGFGRLQFGGQTSAFPSIKRSGTILQARLADDSAYAPLEASTLRVATAFTVATLPAFGTAGRIAYVTDALAPAFLALAVGGGAIVTTVLDNGSAWVTV